MDDMISRQAAMELYKRDYEGKYAFTNADQLYAFLCRVPSAEPKSYRMGYQAGMAAAQRWIPCSERMPKNNGQVLVYARSVHYALAKYDEIREADGTYKKQWVTFDAWKPFYTIKDVLMWMTLPEPYKEDDNG